MRVVEIVHAFQSTPSGGKATGHAGLTAIDYLWFQSTPSGGKATIVHDTAQPVNDVSIHAFRGEGDEAMPKKLHSPMMFQSTPSGGKATAQTFGQCGDVLVSIHAFRGEGDRNI